MTYAKGPEVFKKPLNPNDDQLSLAFDEGPFRTYLKGIIDYGFIRDQIKQQSGLEMSDFTVFYEFSGQGEMGWRLLTNDFRERIRPGERKHILVRAYTFEYQKENMELTDQLQELTLMETEYRLAQQELRRQQYQNNRANTLPKITLLYGCPLYDDQPENVYSHSVKYLKQLNSLVAMLRAAQLDLSFRVEQFHDNSLKDSLDSRILYCVVHSEGNYGNYKAPDYIFGENKYGGLEEVRPSLDETVIPEESRVNLLILQSSNRQLPEKMLGRYARNIIYINSNLLYEDELAEGFVVELFRLLLRQYTIRDAFASSLASLARNVKYVEKFSCCCFHEHDPAVCSYNAYQKKMMRPGRNPDDFNPYKNFHYRYHRLVDCKCPNRFQMQHRPTCEDSIKSKQLKRCCCAESKLEAFLNKDLHSLQLKFQLRESPDTVMNFVFEPGVMTGPEELLRAYALANQKNFARAGINQKTILSRIMVYKKQRDRQNKSRFVINIFGPKGSGKEYLKTMLVNYFFVKRCDLDKKDKWKEVVKQVDEAEAHELAKQNYQLIVLDSTHCYMDMRKLVSTLAVGHTKLILMSEKAVELEDVERFECLPLSSSDAYDFFIRELKKRKLSVDEKPLLRNRLSQLENKMLYPAALRRAVEKLEDFHGRFEDFLDEELTLPTSKLNQELQALQQNEPKTFVALVVLSQWKKLPALSIQFLLGKMELQEVQLATLLSRGMMVQEANEFNYSVESRYRVELKFLRKEELEKVGQLIRLLLMEAVRLNRMNEGNFDRQQLVDGTTNNPSSLLSIYLRLIRGECKEFPLGSFLRTVDHEHARLSHEELYKFLRKNLHVATEDDFYDGILCRELVLLTALVVNLDFTSRHRLIQRSFAKVILRNVNKRRNPNELDLEEVVLAMIVSELQLQSTIEAAVTGQYRRAEHQPDLLVEPDNQAEDKSAEEYLGIHNRLSNSLESKLAISGTLEKYGYLVPAAKMNVFLMELKRITRLQPMVSSKEEAITNNSRLLSPGIRQGDRTKEEPAKVLVRLRHQYEQTMGWLKQPGGQPIKDNHAHLKEVVRLLVSGNYDLRIHAISQLPEGAQSLRDLHLYLESKIRCDNILGCIAKPQPSNEYLKMLEELINVEESLAELAKNSRLSECLHLIVQNYCKQLLASIKRCMEEYKPIFTLLTASPTNCQSKEKKLGVSVDFNLVSNLKRTSLVIEERQMTVSSLNSALSRGSRYICLWFEYSSGQSSQLLMEPDPKDLEEPPKQKRSDSAKETVDRLVLRLPTHSKYVDMEGSTIFVCNNHELAKRLAELNLASSILSFDFDCSHTAYDFYLKKVFQSQVVEYFVRNMQVDREYRRGSYACMHRLDEILRAKRDDIPAELQWFLTKTQLIYSLRDGPEIHSAAELHRRLSPPPPPTSPTVNPPLFPREEPPLHVRFEVCDTNVYLYKSQDAFLGKLARCSRMGLICKDKTLLNHFIDYIKSVCDRKHLFAGGVHVIDWAEDYKPNVEGNESQPVYFLDRKLGIKLPLLARKKSLIFMKESPALFQQKTRDKSTFHYLIKFLRDKDNANISLLFCRNSKKCDNELEEDYEELTPNSFRCLRSCDGKLLLSEQFPASP